jgi:hypothetical protein
LIDILAQKQKARLEIPVIQEVTDSEAGFGQKHETLTEK